MIKVEVKKVWYNHKVQKAVVSVRNYAYKKALSTDSVSAFGGIVSFNQQVGPDVAELMAKIFLEVIIAPSFFPEAMEILTKKKNLRLIEYNKKLMRLLNGWRS